MPGVDILSLFVFAVITAITPGPNNLMGASIGVQFGLRRTWRFLFGMFFGFVIVLMACGLASNLAHNLLERIEPVLRYAGSAYILWLSWKLFRSGSPVDADLGSPVGFSKGLVLQLVNPKVLIYGITIYTTFMAPVLGNTRVVAASVLAFSLVGFVCTTVWAAFGTAIRGFLRTPGTLRAVNVVLSLALAYCAVSLSGLLS